MLRTNDIVSLVEKDNVPDAVFVEKEQDGRYKIVAVSTAALKDYEDETFSIKAIDYDITEAEKTGEYPEYRVFHTKGLGIGQVEKMSRVGIFAVDEGHSYTDKFSLEVCEKMLLDNPDGKWRVSRGFRVLEVAGGCPTCQEKLVIQQKHMQIGFRCPACKSVHATYKGLLEDVQFLKTKTFDVTVTDVPAVPYTGVTAFRSFIDNGETIMTKSQLKQRLLAAGLSEEAINERMKSMPVDKLKEFDDIPEATLLKEFKEATKPPKPPVVDEEEEDDEEEAEDEDEKEYFTLDDSVLDAFRDIVREEVKEVLATAELEIGDTELELKEVPGLDEIREELAELKEMLSELLKSDEARLKEKMRGTSRGGKLRILRAHKETDYEDDEDDEEEDEDEKEFYTQRQRRKDTSNGVAVDEHGNVYGSLSEMVLG